MSKYRDKNIERYAEMFKALSNPNRLKIFMKLTSCCEPGTVTSINNSTGETGHTDVDSDGHQTAVNWNFLCS